MADNSHLISPPGGLVTIPGGIFIMGRSASQRGWGPMEAPEHQVTVSPFRMEKYTVTQKEYQELTGTNPSKFKGDNLPVETVSWYEAIEYCNMRSIKEGLDPAYTIDKDRSDPNNRHDFDTMRWLITWNREVDGYRLPTEAEWEYACRAGTTTPFSTGDTISPSQANYWWYYPDKGKSEEELEPMPVGSFAPNPWDLYDMHGNIWEWCWDWLGKYSGDAQTDPVGAPWGTARVVRGGSWDCGSSSIRSTTRFSDSPKYRHSSFGFRLVCSIP